MTKPKVWIEWSPPADFVARLRDVADVYVEASLDDLPGATLVSPVRRFADGAFMDLAGESLTVLARPGIGVDNVDIAAATERGIYVSNTPDAPTESTAEHAIALLMAIAKRVVVGDMQLRNGVEIDRNETRGTELLGRTLGVVGYGRIGRRVIEIAASGLRMKVLAYDPYVEDWSALPESVEVIDDLDQLFARSNFVTLHTPLMPATRHLANERRLRLMRPGSYLINASRGPVVDEAALIRLLEEGHLAGAALDVFDPEPPEADNPLLKMRNVVLTPHTASNTDRGIDAMMNGTVENMLMALRGERPRYVVNPEAGPGRLGR